MKKFLKEILIICFFTILFGEFICRLFPITADIPIKENNDGFYKLKKHQSGTFIKGKFPKFLRAGYNINNLGFNSVKDYDFNFNNKKSVAIIGDSFIEGFQVDVNKSIGRLMEEENSSINVYEFGLSGFNFLNYVETFNDFDLGKFDHAFIILDYDDIIADYAEKQIFNNYIKNKEFFFRKLYDNFLFFKYLNFNHGIIRKLISIFNFNLNKSETNIVKPFNINKFVLKNNNIKLVLKSQKDTILKSIYPKMKFHNINEEYRPIDFGFDKHWNFNGRKNLSNIK